MAYHIIGDQDTILGFQFAGVDGTVVNDEEQARKAFKNALQDKSIMVLIITEKVEDMLLPEVTAHRMAAVPPYLTVVQDIWGPRGHRRTLQELINEAVGIRISNDDEDQS